MEELLIEEVRANPILYDLKNKGYRNQALRKDTWDDIGEKLGRSGEYCKDTWNKLRNAYTNALSRRKSRCRQESSRKMPKWTYEDQMAFLPISSTTRSRENPRNSIGISQDETQEPNFDNSNDGFIEDFETTIAAENDVKPSLLHIPDDTHSTDDQSDIVPHHFESNSNFQEFATARRRREIKIKNKKLEATMNDLVMMMKSQNRTLSKQNLSSSNTDKCLLSHDDDEIYFLSLARFVKRLKPEERIRVKGEVSQAVFQAELRNLQNEERQRQRRQQQHQHNQTHTSVQQAPTPSTSQNTSSEQLEPEILILNPKIEME